MIKIWTPTPEPSLDDVLAPRALEGEYATGRRLHRGGMYNSHAAFVLVVAVGSVVGGIPWPLTIWIACCTLAAMWLDENSWKRKLRLAAAPGQVLQYLQVAAQAAWDAVPFYLLTLALFLIAAPYRELINLGVNSFLATYGFYLIVRTIFLAWYLHRIRRDWDAQPRRPPLHEHEGNLKTRATAMRHVAWSYFLGNAGLSVRCAAQVVTLAALSAISAALPASLTEHPLLVEHRGWWFAAALAVWLVMMWPGVQRLNLIYYRTHRTFHTNKSLYDSIHAVHHRGVLPTMLDAGTISPAEFLITEMAFPLGVLSPDWGWTLGQIAIAVWGHWPGHHSGAHSALARHHLNHHRHFVVNYGLLPLYDERFGTLSLEEEGPAAAQGAESHGQHSRAS